MKEKTFITLFCLCLTIMFSLSGVLIHIYESQARMNSIQRAELDKKMDTDMFYHVMEKYMAAAIHDYNIIASDIVDSRQEELGQEESINLSPIQAQLLMGGAESTLE